MIKLRSSSYFSHCAHSRTLCTPNAQVPVVQAILLVLLNNPCVWQSSRSQQKEYLAYDSCAFSLRWTTLGQALAVCRGEVFVLKGVLKVHVIFGQVRTNKPCLAYRTGFVGPNLAEFQMFVCD